MKIIWINKISLEKEVKRLLLLMKITWIILFICIFQLQAVTSYGQGVELSIKTEEVSLDQLFNEIEKQSEFLFNYKDTDISHIKAKVNIQNGKIEEVLTEALKNTDLSFSISGRHVTIFKIPQSAKGNRKLITGSVKDDRGELLLGVSIVIKGTSAGTVTDINGIYSIEVPNEQSVLVFNYLGYSTKEVSVEGKDKLDVVLTENSQNLEEIVVVGYGIQKKVNLTGAVGTATSKDLQNKAITNALEGLQGLIPNFNINYNDGNPGSTPNLNVRGFESLNGGEPLIIVDGNQSDTYFLSRLSPEDIENISVLKDASSAAIYGARAAFGVVLVTTKKGYRNVEKTNVSFSSNLILGTPNYLPKMVNSYVHASTVNEALRQKGEPIRFKEEDIEKMRLYHMDPSKYPIEQIDENGDYYFWGTINYMDEVLKKTITRWRNNINVSGGTKLIDYYVSGGYTSDEGIFKYSNADIDIFNVKAKVNANITSWWTIGTNIDYVKDKQSKPHDYLNWWDRIYSQRTYFNIINPVNGYYTNNPLVYLREGSRTSSNETTTVLSFDTKITPLKDWNIYGKYTYREYSNNENDVAKKLYMSDNYGYRFPGNAIWNGSASTSSVSEYSKVTKQNTFDVYSDYETRFAEKHYFKIMVGFNQEEYWLKDFKAKRENMINDKIPSLNLTNGEDYVSQSEYSWATRGAFYRLNYSFKDRYLFETSGRYDGSSRFPKDSRFGFFPSASVGWRISEESFMKWSRKYLDNLKFRITYGALGNQDVSTYAYIASMEAKQINYLLGGQRPIGVNVPALVSPDLTWETVKTLNFGIDFSLFDSRLNGSFDVYERKTLDMLTSGDAMPGILGASAPERNGADLSTKGWELVLNWNDHIGDFTYGISFTLSDSKSKITKYDNPTGSLKTHYEGETIGEIWGYETEGFIDTEEKRDYINNNGIQQYFYNGAWKLGDIQYRDINDDGKVDRGDYTLGNHGDLKVIGNNQAHYNYGISLSAGWKGLSVSAFFQGVGKRDFMPSGYMFWPFSDAWGNIQEHQLDTWSIDNPNAYYPQLEAAADRNYENQTKYLQNGAYIRLKNLSISYELPKQWLKHTFIENARFTLSGRNLWTGTKLIKPYDPEIMVQAIDPEDGTEAKTIDTRIKNGLFYPLKREFAIGIALNF